MFESVLTNLKSLHQREKDRYELGEVERVFHPGNIFKIRFKSQQPRPSKFKSDWSGPHEVVRIRGVLMTVREVSTGREYNNHHDRIFPPVFS